MHNKNKGMKREHTRTTKMRSQNKIAQPVTKLRFEGSLRALKRIDRNVSEHRHKHRWSQTSLKKIK